MRDNQHVERGSAKNPTADHPPHSESITEPISTTPSIMSGYAAGGHYDDGYSHAGHGDSYYQDEHAQGGYYDHQDYGDGYYDQGYVMDTTERT